MEELYQIVKGLHNLLEAKRLELEDAGRHFDSHLTNEFDNREADIENFTQSIALLDQSPFLKNEIMNNYNKDAEVIRQRIADIGKLK